MKQRKRLIFLLLLVLGMVVLMSIRKKSEQPTSPPSSTNAAMELKPAAAPSEETADIAPEENRGEQKSDAQEQTRILKLIVQNWEARPLEGAQIRVWIGRTAGVTNQFKFTNSVATDASGFADLPWPVEKLAWLALSVSKDGYSSRKMVWDAASGDTIPLTHIIKLKSGVNIGGIVVDPDGNPISGARLRLDHFMWGAARPESKGETPDFQRQKQTTDAQGRWRATNLPPEWLDRITIEVKHSDYLGAREDMGKDAKIERQLREGTHKFILQRGLQARGRVLDEQDQPIAGAQVWIGHRDSSERRATKTDGQGKFVFSAANEGKTIFSVAAKGRKPDSKSVVVRTDMEEIVFRLAAGSVIRGVVQNEAGEPIPKVRVALEGNGDIGRTYEFATQTDKEGRFIWDAAPNEPMQFYIGADGYERKRDYVLKPNEDNVVTLRSYRQIQGVVLDADTKQPVTKFRVRVGHGLPEQAASELYGATYQRDFDPPDGRFTMDFTEEENNAVQVSADGYEDQRQFLPKNRDGDMQVSFLLKPTASLSGTVFAPGGKSPVARATVAILPKNREEGMVSLVNGRLEAGYKTKIVTTDADGWFSIPSDAEDGTIVAASAEGFATAQVWQVRAQHRLVLETYGRIEGVLKIAGEPAAGQVISFDMPRRVILTDSYESTTDAEGRFAIGKVPPGKVFVVRRVQMKQYFWEDSHRTPVFIKPGETLQVVLGDSGAVLVGHVSFETPPPNENLTVTAVLYLSRETRQLLMQTPEGIERLNSWRPYRAKVKADGSFVMDSIPPGNYGLIVIATNSNDKPWEEKNIAEGETNVIVPESASPMSPIQLGEIILKPPQP